jgi:hypothetical protein
VIVKSRAVKQKIGFAALCFLVCVIAFVMMVKVVPVVYCGDYVTGVNATSSVVLSAECIEVSDFDNKPQSVITSSTKGMHFWSGGLGIVGFWRAFFSDLVVWPFLGWEQCGFGKAVYGEIKFSNFHQRVLADEGIAPNPKIERGRLPDVFEFPNHYPMMSISGGELALSNSNIRSKLFASRIASQHYTLACSSRGILGGLRRNGGIDQTLTHDSKLPPKQANLRYRCDEEKYGGDSEHPRPKRQVVYIRRLLLAVLFGLIGVGLSCLGGNYLYKDRLLLGASIILSGGLLGCCGLLLCGLSIYPSTWVWWL